MFRRRSALAAILTAWICSSVAAQELTTDAERDWRAVRSSDDERTKIMAERWYNAIRQQEWADATGKFKTSAKYVDHDPNFAWVKLRVIRGAGKERVVKDVQIPLDKLSKACQARVRTISVLKGKIDEAKEDEAKKEAEEENDAGAAGGRGGESLEEAAPVEEAMPEAPRGGRGGFDRGLAGMDPREVVAESEQPPVVTNNGPPLPAALPPLPGRSVAEAAPAPVTNEVATAIARGAASSAGSEHPMSAEQLKTAFAAAFAGGDKATLEQLVYWGDLSPELRQLTQARLLDHAGVAQLQRCELGELVGGESGESTERYTLDSTTVLSLEFETRAGYFDMDWPVGEVDGKYYLGALSGEAAMNRRR